MIPPHAPRLEIDLGAIRHNLALIRSRIPAATRILIPVKADAYGHGSPAVGAFVLANGADRLGVARPSEAVTLRESGIAAPIHVLEAFHPDDAELYFAHGLRPTVAALDAARALSAEGFRRGRKLPAHLKVDTGMSRLGFHWERQRGALHEALQLPGIEWEGIFTHFSRADEPVKHTAIQDARFSALLQELATAGLRPPIAHAANSAGTLLHPSAHLDMVRPGLATYGYHPAADLLPGLDLRPALRLVAAVRHLQWIEAGEEVSYGGIWTAPRRSLIATVPIGYGDGFSRLQKGAVFAVRGRLAPQVGRVCMDLCMADVTDVPGVSLLDPVTVIDGGLFPELSVDAVAARTGTISYELICALGRRLPRLYRDGSESFPETSRA
jgi:alanine racemase